MFYTLIFACTLLSLALSLVAMVFFSKPIHKFLSSILPSELVDAWSTYMRYMIVIVGLGSGVRISYYKQYLEGSTAPLSAESFVLELYATLIDTLSAIGWLIFWLFLIGMIAYIILKVLDRKKSN